MSLSKQSLFDVNEKKSFEDLFKGENPQRIVYEHDYTRIGEKYLNRIAKDRGFSENDIQEIMDTRLFQCGFEITLDHDSASCL